MEPRPSMEGANPLSFGTSSLEVGDPEVRGAELGVDDEGRSFSSSSLERISTQVLEIKNEGRVRKGRILKGYAEDYVL